MGVFRLKKFSLLPRRQATTKDDYGHVLLVAGSKRLSGAALLTGKAALRSGAGLVTLAMPKSLHAPVARVLWETMKLSLPETSEGALGRRALPILRRYIKRQRVRALAVGPGLSIHSETQQTVRQLTGALSVPCVLDADGINSFKGHLKQLRRHSAPLILTPHGREFERLFAEKLPSGEKARLALAKKLSKIYDVLLVLKGHRSLVVSGDRVYVNTTGNPGMATGGSGDVLTGIIASFMGQGLSPFQAASWGVHLHGLAGDLAAGAMGQLSVVAGDLIDYFPKALEKIKRSKRTP